MSIACSTAGMLLLLQYAAWNCSVRAKKGVPLTRVLACLAAAVEELADPSLVRLEHLSAIQCGAVCQLGSSVWQPTCQQLGACWTLASAAMS